MTTYKPDICFYHNFCNDGWASAYSIWTKWPDTEFIGVSHGDPIPFETVLDKNILFVDFSLEGNHIDILPFNTCVILDHHKSAQIELEGFTTFNGSVADLEIKISERTDHNTGVYVHFDMNHSGAYLSWVFANPHIGVVPDAILYTEDQDLWKWDYKESKAFGLAINSVPRDFTYWQENVIQSQDTYNLVKQGEAIIDYQKSLIDMALRNSEMVTWHGYPNVARCNSSLLQSEIGNALLTKYPQAQFAAVWYVQDDGQNKYSLRSEDSRTDVSEVAVSLGGGGHRNASGVVM